MKVLLLGVLLLSGCGKLWVKPEQEPPLQNMIMLIEQQLQQTSGINLRGVLSWNAVGVGDWLFRYDLFYQPDKLVLELKTGSGSSVGILQWGPDHVNYDLHEALPASWREQIQQPLMQLTEQQTPLSLLRWGWGLPLAAGESIAVSGESLYQAQSHLPLDVWFTTGDSSRLRLRYRWNDSGRLPYPEKIMFTDPEKRTQLVVTVKELEGDW